MQGNLACVDVVEGAAWLMGSSHPEAVGSLDVFQDADVELLQEA
jgi:hypothetical protein